MVICLRLISTWDLGCQGPRDPTQPLDIAPGGLAEQLLVLAIEMGRIVIAHAVSGARDVDLTAEQEPTGLLQPELLL